MLVNDGTGHFTMFCLELDEHISVGYSNILHPYRFTIGTAADGGGLPSGGVSNPDPLDPWSAYLYTKYWYSASQMPALQEAIWYIEGELPSMSSTEAQNLYAEAQLAGWTNIGNAVVLNVYLDWDNSGTYNQADIENDRVNNRTSQGKRQSQIARGYRRSLNQQPCFFSVLGLWVWRELGGNSRGKKQVQQ